MLPDDGIDDGDDCDIGDGIDDSDGDDDGSPTDSWFDQRATGGALDQVATVASCPSLDQIHPNCPSTDTLRLL